MIIDGYGNILYKSELLRDLSSGVKVIDNMDTWMERMEGDLSGINADLETIAHLERRAELQAK